MGFPDSSVGKESVYNAEDPSSIPGLGKSTGESKGYPLQYSWAFFVAQLVKNPPAMWESWVQSVGWEDPLEMGQLCEADYNKSFKWLAKGTYLNEDCSGYHHPFPSFFFFFFNEWLYLQFQFPLKKKKLLQKRSVLSWLLILPFALLYFGLRTSKNQLLSIAPEVCFAKTNSNGCN